MSMKLENEPSGISIPQAQNIALGKLGVVDTSDPRRKTSHSFDVLEAIPTLRRDAGDHGG